jgi:hypothetical protein
MRGMRENSVVGRLKRFYEDNPEEELTFPDICAKFSCSYGAAAEAVKQLRHLGFLESVSVIRTRKKGMGL